MLLYKWPTVGALSFFVATTVRHQNSAWPRKESLRMYDLQKASWWKRFSAFLFDAIILATLAVGLAALLSLVFGYDSQLATYAELKNEYSEKYGIELDISQEKFDKLSADERAKYDEANEEWVNDLRVAYTYTMLVNLSLVIVSMALLIAFLALELTVPLFLRNGQTLGKKIFGVAVMQTTGVRVKGVSMFVRTVLGKFAVETMIPVYVTITVLFGNANLVGLAAAAAVLLTNLIMPLATKTRVALHDGLASTVTVDFASQMIFDSEEALIEYKKRLAAQRAENSEY